MNLLAKITEIIKTEVVEPVAYGGLHLLCILLVALVTGFLCYKLLHFTDRGFRAIILASFGVMLVLEVVKQTLFQFSLIDGIPTFKYAWKDFPFQLCSTPIYVLPFLGLLRDGRARDFAASYIMTVGLIGGLVVYAAPDSVLTAMAFTNVQSMIHHGLQILTGIVTAVHYRKRITSAFCLRGIALFSVMFAIANLLNTVGFNLLVLSGAMPADANFNMFYISPNPNLPFPMLDGLFSLFHPAVYITGYYVAIVIGIILICYATVLIDRLVSGRRSDEVDK